MCKTTGQPQRSLVTDLERQEVWQILVVDEQQVSKPTQRWTFINPTQAIFKTLEWNQADRLESYELKNRWLVHIKSPMHQEIWVRVQEGTRKERRWEPEHRYCWSIWQRVGGRTGLDKKTAVNRGSQGSRSKWWQPHQETPQTEKDAFIGDPCICLFLLLYHSICTEVYCIGSQLGATVQLYSLNLQYSIHIPS